MSYSEAMKEAMATARSNDPVLDTIEIAHSLAKGGIFLIKNWEDLMLPLNEGGAPIRFRASGMEITLPEKGPQGIQDLAINISNIGREVSDFLQLALTVPKEPIILRFRPYLKSDLSRPHFDPPLELSLSGVTIDNFQVNGIASVTDFLNRKFLSERYTEERFPAL